MRHPRSLAAALSLLVLLLAGCRDSAQPTLIVIPVEPTAPPWLVSIRIEPFPAVVGASTLHVNVTQGEDNQPVTGLSVSARGDMNHAGMTPVLGDGGEGEPGVYDIPWEWTMAGDWTLDITVRTADGSEQVESIAVLVGGG